MGEYTFSKLCTEALTEIVVIIKLQRLRRCRNIGLIRSGNSLANLVGKQVFLSYRIDLIQSDLPVDLLVPIDIVQAQIV